MRIGLVAPFFLPHIGRANRYCFELAKSLAEKGLEIHLFTAPGALADPAYQLHPILSLDLGKDMKLLKNYPMDIWHSLFFYYVPLALFKPNVFVTAHGDDGFSQQVKMRLPGARTLEHYVLWRLPRARVGFSSGASESESYNITSKKKFMWSRSLEGSNESASDWSSTISTESLQAAEVGCEKMLPC
jgi:hypothetical protein